MKVILIFINFFLVLVNLKNAETFGGRISQLEPDYQRLSSYFEEQVKELIKQFPELKDVLETSSPVEEEKD